MKGLIKDLIRLFSACPIAALKSQFATGRSSSRKCNLWSLVKFSLVGFSNEKSFLENYFIGQLIKLHNDVLDLHIALAKKCILVCKIHEKWESLFLGVKR